MSDQRFTHALNLNTDRELSHSRIGRIFGTFCHNIDRQILCAQNVRGYPLDLRLNAIAFPEHLETNAHLHGHADLSAFIARGMDEPAIAELIRRTWLQSTRGAGSVVVKKLLSTGFAGYSMKAAHATAPAYFLASDFHPL
jgi:hypothetical protein